MFRRLLDKWGSSCGTIPLLINECPIVGCCWVLTEVRSWISIDCLLPTWRLCCGISIHIMACTTLLLDWFVIIDRPVKTTIRRHHQKYCFVEIGTRLLAWRRSWQHFWWFGDEAPPNTRQTISLGSERFPKVYLWSLHNKPLLVQHNQFTLRTLFNTSRRIIRHGKLTDWDLLSTCQKPIFRKAFMPRSPTGMRTSREHVLESAIAWGNTKHTQFDCLNGQFSRKNGSSGRSYTSFND